MEPPLKLIREELSLRLYYRILSHPHHPLHTHLLSTEHDTFYRNKPSFIPSFGLRLRNIVQGTSLSSIKARSQTYFIPHPWSFKRISCLHIFNGFNKSNAPLNVLQSIFAAHRQNYSSYIDIYTDGSKAGNLVGCGIVCQNIILSYHLPSLFSVFSAEFLAIEIALKFISSQSHKHFIIYSDSKSALDSLESGSCSPTFISVLNLYNELVKKGYNILFCWIPGHAGIKGNEQADIAAKQASNPLNCTIPYSDLKNTIRNLIKDKWQINWNLQANNKLKQIKPTITPWPSIPCRKTDVLLTRLRIGHSRITHRHLLLGEAEPTCPHCFFSQLTIHHILTDCCGLRHLYRQYFKTSFPQLTNLIGEKPHNALIYFLKDSGFYYNI